MNLQQGYIATRRRWSGMRALKELKLIHAIARMSKCRSGERFAPLVFVINGVPSYDRLEWLLGARDFGTRRFADCDNDADQQHVRMQDLLTCASRDYLSGAGSGGLEFWDVVQARSKIRKGGVAGADGNSSDIFRELPFMTLFQVYEMFCKRSSWNAGSGDSPLWQVLQCIGLLKHSKVSSFEDLRWICKSPVLQRWYMRSLQPLLRQNMQPSKVVHSYGFRSGFST